MRVPAWLHQSSSHKHHDGITNASGSYSNKNHLFHCILPDVFCFRPFRCRRPPTNLQCILNKMILVISTFASPIFDVMYRTGILFCRYFGRSFGASPSSTQGALGPSVCNSLLLRKGVGCHFESSCATPWKPWG